MVFMHFYILVRTLLFKVHGHTLTLRSTLILICPTINECSCDYDCYKHIYLKEFMRTGPVTPFPKLLVPNHPQWTGRLHRESPGRVIHYTAEDILDTQAHMVAVLKTLF